MNDRQTTLTDRITYAEDWLDHARRRLNDGEVTEGTLALVLAEAELHRAREAGRDASTSPARGARRPWAAWTALGALALAAAVLVVSVALLRPAPLDRAGGPVAPVVRLSAGTGDLLRIVTPPSPVVERTIVEPKIVHVRVRVPVPVATRPASVPEAVEPSKPPVRAPQAAPPASPAVQPAPAPHVAVVSPPAVTSLLTDAEVIDMVLAAERSLRRAGNQ